VRIGFDRLPYRYARWIEGGEIDFDQLELPGRQSCVVDVEGRPLVLFETEYLLRRTEEKYKDVTFISAVQPGRSHRAAA
jgi:peptide subunit release factor RF-3